MTPSRARRQFTQPHAEHVAATIPFITAFSFVAIAALALLAASPAHATWQPGGNVLASGPSNQQTPLMVSDGSGGIIVFWTDDGAPAGSQMIGQHLDAAGNTSWGAAGHTIPITFSIADATLFPVSDQQGGAIAITCASLSTARAQRMNGTGSALWTTGGMDVFSTAPLNTYQIYPSTIPAGGTSPTTDPVGIMTTWDEKVSSLGGVDIYAQRLDANGAPMWGTLANPTIVCNAGGDQFAPVVCTDGASGPGNTHGAYVAWADPRTGLTDVYVNRLSNGGTPAWPNGMPVLSQGTLSSGPYIDYFGSNSALVAWFDTRVAGSIYLYAQKVLPNGSMAWASDGVLVAGALGSRSGLLMVASGDGGEIMAWIDSRTDIADVYAQKIDANGNPLWTPGGVPVCTATNRQLVDGLVPDGSGGAYLFWFDRRTVANSDLYAQHLDASGNALWDANGRLLVPLHITPGALQLYALPDGTGGFFLSWQDKVSGTYDAFISRFNSQGTQPVLGAEPTAPGALRLALASPNPSLGGAAFTLELPQAGAVDAEVVDLQGRVVSVLLRSDDLAAGVHPLAWDGRTESGAMAGPGLYFVVARTAGGTRSIKFAELR